MCPVRDACSAASCPRTSRHFFRCTCPGHGAHFHLRFHPAGASRECDRDPITHSQVQAGRGRRQYAHSQAAGRLERLCGLLLHTSYASPLEKRSVPDDTSPLPASGRPPVGRTLSAAATRRRSSSTNAEKSLVIIGLLGATILGVRQVDDSEYGTVLRSVKRQHCRYVARVPQLKSKQSGRLSHGTQELVLSEPGTASRLLSMQIIKNKFKS